ncbi:hypothetical protein [Dyella telluris]|uniref:DUF2946 domain-containing protein n=1 Tax=Dyella telluris TaxID=2763498 RepID=A0A7G8Q423_9GAMM|nr:hypothetical protein [Dyella telluris]QNK01531.1 hypothetical protein H8F01_21270 [Dyella telluris]
MSLRSPPLFHRLRRHRGLWALVVAVLLIKLVSGSLCLADGGERDMSVSQGHVVATAAFDAPATQPAGDGDCLLGEGTACHCACAHAATLPASAMLAIGMHVAPFVSASVPLGRVPSMTGSLLRPPIA